MSANTVIDSILDDRREPHNLPAEPEEIEDNAYFGIWKGAHREYNERYVDFQMRNGDCTSFDYPDRKFVNYNAEESSIDISFSNDMVTIYGRNLKPLYQYLLQRKVQWLREADDPDNEVADDSNIFVENILLTPGDFEPEGSAAE